MPSMAVSVNVGTVASRIVIVATPRTPVPELARLMRENHVGALPVISIDKGVDRVVGIVTDRDLVVEVLASDVAPATLVASDIMSTDVVTINEDASIFDAIEAMQRNAIRRLLLSDADGRLVGIVTMDDVIELLAEEMGKLARAIRRAQQREERLRPAR